MQLIVSSIALCDDLTSRFALCESFCWRVATCTKESVCGLHQHTININPNISVMCSYSMQETFIIAGQLECACFSIMKLV